MRHCVFKSSRCVVRGMFELAAKSSFVTLASARACARLSICLTFLVGADRDCCSFLQCAFGKALVAMVCYVRYVVSIIYLSRLL